jgi:predicted Zn-dependent protease
MKHATRMLAAQPALAAEQAREILKVVPKHAPAAFLLAKALARIGRGDEAIAALRSTVRLQPDHPDAWRLLADHLMAVGETAEADRAYAQHISNSARDPTLMRAAAAMIRNDIPQAEALLKAYLKKSPTDVPAIRMLAEVAVRVGRDEEAEKLLERCLELAPGFSAARYNYAVLLHRSNDPQRALTEIERLLAAHPRNPGFRNLLAVVLSRVGEYERSARTYAELVAEYPANTKLWLSYGHVLKTEGRQDESIAAYRRAIALEPGFGEAYWSLANLKTFRFTGSDFAAMRAGIEDPMVDEVNRVHLHFALGKANEDAGDYAASFEHYAKGNALHRARNPHDADLNTKRAERLKAVFTRELFAARAGGGCPAANPIFIVGMPRAGSTLLEQILSTHSAVEGTTELPDMITLARDLRAQSESGEIGAYADVLAAMGPQDLRELGERYLERTRVHRKTDRPHFIDKMPNNFLHVAMIHLALPNARIIDARRHPMACCFSNFKQHYARGQRFSYDLADMGRFYRDYVMLMAHFDAVLPGRIHRVFYEGIIEDTEGEVRRLLDYCGLPFEPECLRYFENARPVRTASSEQVRQPIYRDGLEQWRHYEDWLDPLKLALGPVLSAYPDAPVLTRCCCVRATV